MRDLDRLIEILDSANGAVVSEAFAADCAQAAGLLRVAFLHAPPGIKRIANERVRQMTEEVWPPEHDDLHTDGEMAQAAAAYAIHSRGGMGTDLWPWEASWWKPRDRLRDLERAGALIAAEIDRILRMEAGHG